MAKLLVLNFFPAFTPASSGGELRLGNLYRAMSAHHDVTMLTSTDFNARFEEIRHTIRFRELRFPKDALWRRAYQTLENSGVHGDLSGMAFALAVSDPECRLRQTAWTLAPDVDYIIHEFPFSEPIFADGAPRPEIYNSHNFEASLLSAIAHGSGLDSAFLKLNRMEGNLVRRARRVFATSAEDAAKFRLYYGVDKGKLSLCPNGIDETELSGVAERRGQGAPTHDRAKLLFMGSAHPPNVDAAAFLVSIANDLPECDIILAGGVSKAFADKDVPANIILFGAFGPQDKQTLFAEADVFLNPVTLGSGTSLKALEALSAGVPMVSTQEGVRGLGLLPDVHAKVIPRGEFASAVREILSNGEAAQGMAAAGRDLALANFTWSAIVGAFTEALAVEDVAPEPAAPFVLALNDYPVHLSNSGGVARILNIHEHTGFEAVLITFGHAYEIILVTEKILLVTIAKTESHIAYEVAVNEGQTVSVNDGVASLFVASNRVLREVASSIVKRAGAVIFEHPYMAPLLPTLRLVRSDIAVVYSAHNVEATHKLNVLREHSAADILVEFIAKVEAFAVESCDMIVCCTDDDASYFRKLHPSVIVAANGCKVPALAHIQMLREAGGPHESPRVGFLGSSHGPNVVALNFILERIAPKFKDITFEVIGGVCSAIDPSTPPNVTLYGAVAEAEKTRIMAQWDMALNPVKSGGGSSLKLPDYMAHGLATISTPSGARGFDVEGQGAGQVAPLSAFGTALKTSIGNPRKLQRQRQRAYCYAAEHLSWHVCMGPYRDRLNALVAARPPAPLAKAASLLVVTYRYTEPPMGGAEEYLIEVLKHLRPRFGRLDLAAIDVGHITNVHHFATQVGQVGQGAAARVGELFDRAMYFPPDEPPVDVMEQCRELARGWAADERTLLARFAHDLADGARLRFLGGFFWPEFHDGIARRWTSPEFAFLLPTDALVFRLAGYGSVRKTLRIAFGQVLADGSIETLTEAVETIEPYFSLNLSLPSAPGPAPTIVICSVEEHHAVGDHRPFGVLLERVSVLLHGGGQRSEFQRIAQENIACLPEVFADLTEDHELELRNGQFKRWLQALHGMALKRSEQAEASFSAVRGPHSAPLQSWLASNASRYDTILVQGIPFDVIPRTVETLAGSNNRPGVITLPHFHGDDRFYYWRRYLDAFASADKTLLFSDSVGEVLAIGDRVGVVPGGGVRPEEHADSGAVSKFRSVHASNRPFFLVLGRKTGSKGYERIVSAHRVLRESGVEVDLVLIGPDEDGKEIHSNGVYYLGRQPREVVRGALDACLAVVTMSASESFGIVLCEAWLFGKPVIANRTCYSFRELVKDNENGVLVHSLEELVAAMQVLAGNERARKHLGRNGFNCVVEKFTWPNVARAILQVVENRPVSLEYA